MSGESNGSRRQNPRPSAPEDRPPHPEVLRGDAGEWSLVGDDPGEWISAPVEDWWDGSIR